MYKTLFGYFALSIYFLVLAVAVTEGPLISFQSIILGFIGLIALIIIASELAKVIHLVDIPDSKRKKHKGQIPLIGGIVLFISFIYGAIVFGVDSFYRSIIFSLAPIVIIGTIDGMKGFKVPNSYRIVAQILASWIVIISTDVYIENLGNLFGIGDIHLNKFGIPFTIFCVVGACNAFNMLDGKDGLAGGVSIVLFASLMLILYLNNIIFNWGLILILSLLVYLAFNLSLFGHKRKIFLGDHGSTGLGHIVAWNLIYLSQETELITPVSALYFAAVPIIDALLTISRRLRSSQPVFNADNRHFHHILSNWGYSDFIILLIINFMAAIAGLLAVASNYFKFYEYNLFFGFLTMFVSLVILGRVQTKNDKK